MASSRVGVRMTPRGRFFSVRPPASRVSSGRPKDSVLPEPVRPRPRMSLPSSASGMVAAWIGNGVVTPFCASLRTIASGRPRSANVMVGASSAGAGAASSPFSGRTAWSGMETDMRNSNLPESRHAPKLRNSHTTASMRSATARKERATRRASGVAPGNGIKRSSIVRTLGTARKSGSWRAAGPPLRGPPSAGAPGAAAAGMPRAPRDRAHARPRPAPASTPRPAAARRQSRGAAGRRRASRSGRRSPGRSAAGGDTAGRPSGRGFATRAAARAGSATAPGARPACGRRSSARATATRAAPARPAVRGRPCRVSRLRAVPGGATACRRPPGRRQGPSGRAVRRAVAPPPRRPRPAGRTAVRAAGRRTRRRGEVRAAGRARRQDRCRGGRHGRNGRDGRTARPPGARRDSAGQPCPTPPARPPGTHHRPAPALTP